MMMKFKYYKWNRGYKELATESITLSKLDDFNKTRYSRRKNQEGMLELASKEAHDKKQTYFATFFYSEKPFCFMECNAGFFYIGFLDEFNRVYLSYSFDEFEPNKLFMKQASFAEFDGNNEDAIKRTNYNFEPNGELKIISYFENEQEILTVQEPMDVSDLWENYPGFGNYDDLIKLERLPKDLHF